MNVPSASNTTGTLLGALAGAAVSASLPSLAITATIATALGMTPMGLAGVLAIGATALVNYLATHVAQVKGLDESVSNWWPMITAASAIKVDPDYNFQGNLSPGTPNDSPILPTVTTNLKSGSDTDSQ